MIPQHINLGMIDFLQILTIQCKWIWNIFYIYHRCIWYPIPVLFDSLNIVLLNYLSIVVIFTVVLWNWHTISLLLSNIVYISTCTIHRLHYNFIKTTNHSIKWCWCVDMIDALLENTLFIWIMLANDYQRLIVSQVDAYYAVHQWTSYYINVDPDWCISDEGN